MTEHEPMTVQQVLVMVLPRLDRYTPDELERAWKQARDYNQATLKGRGQHFLNASWGHNVA